MQQHHLSSLSALPTPRRFAGSLPQIIQSNTATKVNNSFVTLLVDSKLPGLKGKTMFQRAVDLGLPASFVELRHEATHRELPSLVVLRNASQRSLEWLWDYYWVKVDFSAPSGGDDTKGSEMEYAKIAIRDCLSELAEERGPPRKKRRRVEDQDFVAARVSSTCLSSAAGKIALARVLIEDSVLIPRERKYVLNPSCFNLSN